VKTTPKLRGVALLIAIAGSIVALTPTPAPANTGDALILGQINQAGAETALNSSTIHGLTVTAQNTGIDGSGTYIGVNGTGTGTGGSVGVRGVTQSPSTNSDGVWGLNSGQGNGVFGLANNSGASGVYGQNNGDGYGVAGRAANGNGVLGDSANGTGVWANSSAGLALRVTGRANFSRSGVVVVQAGHTSAIVTGMQLSGSSFVLATLQNNNGNVALKNAVPIPQYGAIQLNLTAAPTANVIVGWLVLEP